LRPARRDKRDIMTDRAQRYHDLRERLRELYLGPDPEAHRFRYGLLVFDVVTVVFVIATSFAPPSPLLNATSVVFGIAILADFLARLTIAPSRTRYLFSFGALVDIVSMLAFLAPIIAHDLGFVRALRTLRLLRTYQLLARLRRDFPFFREHEQVLFAALNLVIFLFVMTGVIYATQHLKNPQINNYADALYFTVTALTTTGFGDITLEGTQGRLLSVVVMIVGVTLFLRLAQVLFRPPKVRHPCPDCGLTMHDSDAVHCKHCGRTLNIPNEGVS
jgi:voltage-gated potassium channel